MKRLILSFALVLLNLNLAQAAHERTVNQLVQQLNQSVPALKDAINNRRGMEAAFSRVYVQASEGYIRAQLNAGNQPNVPDGTLVDPSQQASHDLANASEAIQRLDDALEGVKNSIEQGDTVSVEGFMQHLVVATDVAAYHVLQNGFVNPNGPTIAGIGPAFEVVGNVAYMSGTIDSRIVRRVRDLPLIRDVVMITVPGSADDSSNLQAIRLMRRRGVNTDVMIGGSVESGGTDFLLAGVNRTVSINSFVGVHSWAGGAGGSGFALRNNRNHPAHQPFLQLYNELGIPASFYFFTLQTRPENMHYMTTAELNQFGVTKFSNDLGPDDLNNDSGNNPQDDLDDDLTVDLDDGSDDLGSGFDTRLVGLWHERQRSTKTASVGFRKSGAFIVVNSKGRFTGQATVRNGVLTLETDSGKELKLNYQLQGNTVRFAGKSIRWVKVSRAAEESKERIQLSGNWIEVRHDSRPNKRITVSGNRFVESVNGQQTRGNISLNGTTLVLGNETFKVEQIGDELRFFELNGRPVQRFHWERG